MTTYAITGATGHFGQTAVKALAQDVGARNVIALARNAEKAAKVLPADIAVRPGSYEDVATLTTSLQGVDRLLFISSQPGGATSRPEQHANVVNAAKAAGVKLIAYTSYGHLETAKAPLADDHKTTEALIKASGLTYTFLRNNWYLENDLNVLKAGAAGQPFVYAAGDGKAGWALERDYATAAAKVLQLAEPKAVYEFSGPAHTYAELAAAVKAATGKDFPVQSISEEAYQAGLEKSGMDSATASIVTGIQDLIKIGDLAGTTDDLPNILGHSLPSLAESIKEVLAK